MKEAEKTLGRKRSIDGDIENDRDTEILENLDEETAEYYKNLPKELRNDLKETLVALLQAEKNANGEDFLIFCDGRHRHRNCWWADFWGRVIRIVVNGAFVVEGGWLIGVGGGGLLCDLFNWCG